MPKPSRLTLAKDDILSLFSKASQKIYSEAELSDLLVQNRQSWRLAKSTSTYDFMTFLAKSGELKRHNFQSKHYGHSITRYSWGEVTSLALAQSLKPRGYLCHGTAVALHGLAKLNPRTIYLNVEQSPKSSRPTTLTQDAIDRAFTRQQRRSNLVYVYGGTSVTVIAGKSTKQLGVEEINGPSSRTLQVTNLERTLIDIAVRPVYSGGISQVLNAYRAAKDRVRVDHLLTTLKNLGYIYPYHQAIGFLMHRAGYPEETYTKLRTLGFGLDFYLAHNMEPKEYCKDWRLFYPRDL